MVQLLGIADPQFTSIFRFKMGTWYQCSKCGRSRYSDESDSKFQARSLTEHSFLHLPLPNAPATLKDLIDHHFQIQPVAEFTCTYNKVCNGTLSVRHQAQSQVRLCSPMNAVAIMLGRAQENKRIKIAHEIAFDSEHTFEIWDVDFEAKPKRVKNR